MQLDSAIKTPAVSITTPDVCSRTPGADEEARLWPRFGRQLVLDGWGLPAQQRLATARVLIVGLGGLGSLTAGWLAAAGVGELWLSDSDQVSLSNLHRQLLYRQTDVGWPKARQARRHLLQLAAGCRLHTVAAVNADNIASLLFPDGHQARPVDLVLDGCDDPSTRLLLNQACLHARVPLLSAAVSGWQGSVALFDFRQSTIDSGCYACLYPQTATTGACQLEGVLGPVAGLVASQQALQALQFLGNGATPSAGCVDRLDGRTGMWRRWRRRRDPACPCCQGHFTDVPSIGTENKEVRG